MFPGRHGERVLIATRVPGEGSKNLLLLATGLRIPPSDGCLGFSRFYGRSSEQNCFRVHTEFRIIPRGFLNIVQRVIVGWSNRL
jgi:hypothetical protein